MSWNFIKCKEITQLYGTELAKMSGEVGGGQGVDWMGLSEVMPRQPTEVSRILSLPTSPSAFSAIAFATGICR